MKFLPHAVFVLVFACSLFVVAGAVYCADDKPGDAAIETLADFEETWQVVYIAKSRVGHQRSSSGRLSRDGRDLVVTDTEMAMAISRLGQPVKIKTVVKTQ